MVLERMVCLEILEHQESQDYLVLKEMPDSQEDLGCEVLRESLVHLAIMAQLGREDFLDFRVNQENQDSLVSQALKENLEMENMVKQVPLDLQVYQGYQVLREIEDSLDYQEMALMVKLEQPEQLDVMVELVQLDSEVFQACQEPQGIVQMEHEVPQEPQVGQELPG